MKDFTKAVAIRVTRQACFELAGLIGGAVLISDVDWKYVLSATALSCLVTALTCVGTGLPEVDDFDEIAEDEEEE